MTAVSAPPRFRGFPIEVFDFFADLEENNEKAWWQEHRHVYDEQVVPAFDALSHAVADEFGALSLFRPYRDTRFSKDKSPYKTHAGALTRRDAGTTYYVEVSGAGLGIGAGYHHPAPDQLDRFRQAVDRPRTGQALVAVQEQLAAADLPLQTFDALKTAPRGYPKDHPRIELLRMKGVLVFRRFDAGPRWLDTANALDRIVEVWRTAAPLADWLDANVGPSELADDARRR